MVGAAFGLFVVLTLGLSNERYPAPLVGATAALLALQLAWQSFWLGRLPEADGDKGASLPDKVWATPGADSG